MEQSANEIRVTHFTFPSMLGTAQSVDEPNVVGSHGVLWMPPAGQPVSAIVQITHGMSEYIERYDHFARFLAAHGFAVCGQDNIGHGKSVASPDDWGHIPARGGKKALIENVHVLRGIMEKLVTEEGVAAAGGSTSTSAPATAVAPGAAPDAAGAAVAPDAAAAAPADADAPTTAPLPYFMFGHSMGSFILRDYLAHYGAGLAGAIICGTGHQSAAVATAGLAAAKAVARAKGERHVSDTLFNLADGAYGKAIKGARTELDWLSTNPLVVDAYLADPACGFRFSAGAYIALTGLLVDVSKKSNINRIPKELPLYLIAGSEDPVGGRGRGVTRVLKEYKEAGIKDVDMRLYLGARHEILNEVDKEKVYADVLKWLEVHLV